MAEISGVPHALHEFSQRRLQVVERLTEWGTTSWHAAQAAARKTRERKEYVDLAQLREDWRARAAEHSLSPRELSALLHRTPLHQLASGQLRELAGRLLGPEGLTERRTTFSEPDLVVAWAEAHVQGAPAERVRTIARRFARIEEVERVGGEPQPGRPAFFTTSELIAVRIIGEWIRKRATGSWPEDKVAYRRIRSIVTVVRQRTQDLPTTTKGLYSADRTRLQEL